MTTHELLADLRNQGFQLTPLPGDRLEVRPFSKLPEELRAELKRRKSEVLTLLTQQQASPWPCPHCGQPAEIEDVCPSLNQTTKHSYTS
jgi:TubC N-terminal docking domain